MSEPLAASEAPRRHGDDWPVGDGAMAARVRGYDWTTTPLGSRDAWPASLRAAVELVVASPMIASLAVGPSRILIYNDATAPFYGDLHPAALGQPLPVFFGSEYARVAPLYDRVFAGESVHVPAEPLDTAGAGEDELFDAYLTPVRDGDGTVIAAHMTGFAVAARLRAEAALKESEARQAFQLRLADALRPVDDPEAIKGLACRLLGEHLGLSRVYYLEYDASTADGRIGQDHVAAGLPSLTGRYPYASFRTTYDGVAEGRTWVVPDVEAETEIAAPERTTFAHSGVAAWIDVPLVKAGVLVAVLCATQAVPRAWTNPEIALVEATADRTWAAVERARAEAALSDSEERFRNLVGAWAQSVWDTGAEGFVTADSPGSRAYTGQTYEQWAGFGWVDAIHPDDRAYALRQWREAVAARRAVDAEFRLRRPDGGWSWTNIRAAPLLNQDGTVRKWVGMNIDITARREAEAALRHSQDRLRVLIAELQHRVRNMLTVVRSVFLRTAETGGDLESVVDHFQGRLDALARTQVIVTQNASGAVNLEDLIRDELLSVGVSDGPALTIEGPEVALPSKAAESLGLAIHELTTNAIKYGALRIPSARLEIQWSINMDHGDGPRLHFRWTEKGVPALPLRPARTGFGRELIEEALPYRLGADTKLEFRGGGVCCVISLPLPDGGGPAAM